MTKDEIRSIIYNLLKIKFDSKIYNNQLELEKAKKDFENQVDNLTNYILNTYLKTDELTIDFIKWLHKSFYPEWTIIKTIRDGKNYDNLVWEYRLHENTHKEDNHHHSYQKNIEIDLINYTNYYNSIKTKKRTDILKYYFDFLKIHPFADSNLTIISIICELEFFKHWFNSLNFLQTRFKDGKFNYFFLYEYENNKEKPWILEKIEKMIDDFFDWKLSKETIEKKDKINVKTTNELFWKIDYSQYETQPYFIELNNFLQINFINFSQAIPDYYARKIVYNNTLHYLKNALFRAFQEHHQIILNGYVCDTNKIIQFIHENVIQKDFEKLEISFIKQLHKILYPEWFVLKNKDINGNEYIQMIPWEFRNIDLVAKEFADKKLYYKWQEIEAWLKNIISDFNDSKKHINDILLFMIDFITIHPFWDGNWRIADILTDLLLLKNWFEPYYFGWLKKKDEIWFYKIRNEVAKTRDIKYFYEFLEKYSI